MIGYHHDRLLSLIIFSAVVKLTMSAFERAVIIPYLVSSFSNYFNKIYMFHSYNTHTKDNLHADLWAKYQQNTKAVPD